ncbi:Hydroxyacylglutathione hydrolase GloC [Acaryochloris thomasi RCC1774]|uniref:Hydroxyacylglutathione hydrolase GloC n=1 Tax=Acaryochloris thomasi RCC1774 TaxID=1764569 RepID=A0A2W1JRC6_9CYAN|nr:MBL fold metallo-hydrolase [Acaryochloris thomasi]PZD73865.1 Hydroxyacylglutathione hydrolase GloC [Acaryochloris thomasi RCC1774]
MSTPIAINDRWFTTERISDDLYLITEPHYFWWNRANLWLIKGQTQDLLIDTGLGVASLRHYLTTLIDKPLLAIASHIHFDHAGGMVEFNRRAIHQAEASALCHGDNYEALCTPRQGWVLPEHFEQAPYPGFTVSQYTLRAAEPTQILNEGDVLDLGNRAFEVMHLPGHSHGCIALYDPRSREIFSGDVIYDGELLDGLHCSDISTYIASYERLQKLSVETVYPGHYRTFGKAKYDQIIGEYLDAKRKPGCPAEQARESLS